jgi:group I intron endonuclease
MNYIYGLINPITKELRYVGKTNNLKIRLQGHKDETKRGVKSHKNNWIKGLLKEGLNPEIIIIDEIESDDWSWLEIYWISQFKTWGFNLTNATDGGENPPSWLGKTHSDEYKIIRSKIMIENNPAKNMTDNWKNNIRKSHIENKFQPPESAYNKIRKPVLQYSLDDEFIKEWDSATKAAEGVGLKRPCGISATCLGNRNKSGGFKWKFKE